MPFNRNPIGGLLAAVIVIVVVVVIVIAVTNPFHGKNNASGKATSPTATVKIVKNSQTVGAYSPNVVRIRLGQSVAFENVSGVAHSVTANNKGFDSGLIDPGKTWTVRPSRTGNYLFHCSVHPNMRGTLTVLIPGRAGRVPPRTPVPGSTP